MKRFTNFPCFVFGLFSKCWCPLLRLYLLNKHPLVFMTPTAGIRCFALQARKAKSTLVKKQLLWSHMTQLRINTNSMSLNFILAREPAASATLKKDKLDIK